MKDKLLKIIKTYGVLPQLEYLHTEMCELVEAIIDYKYVEVYKGSPAEKFHKDHIGEEIADNFVMLYQFPVYYFELLDNEDNITEYVYKSDNFEEIHDISKYVKSLQKDLCKLTCCIGVLEERDQDYVIVRQYEKVVSLISNIMYKLESICEFYGIKRGYVEQIAEFKIERQLKRIEESDNNVCA